MPLLTDYDKANLLIITLVLFSPKIHVLLLIYPPDNYIANIEIFEEEALTSLDPNKAMGINNLRSLNTVLQF